MTELRRLGINPAVPTDLYAFAEPAESDPSSHIPHRVTFHTVGEILSGPGVWTEDARLGPVRTYVPVAELAGRGGLSVGYEREVGGESAAWHRTVGGALIQIDFRLGVPWILDERRPAVFTTLGHRVAPDGRSR